MATIAQLPRPEMKRIGRLILTSLEERKVQGPPEQVLDELIPELTTVVTELESGVKGQGDAAAALKAVLAKVEAADVDVDTWYRHVYHFISVEADRRAGPNVEAARALADAAFPDGLSHIDDYIPEENALCRASIEAIKSPKLAATVAAIKLPMEWLDAWAAALDSSTAAFNEAKKLRANKSVQVVVGQDAEVDFVDVMTRLKSYIAHRAPRADEVKLAQGKLLIQPLLDALAKMRAEERSRATKKKNATAKKDQPAPAATPAEPATTATSPAASTSAKPLSAGDGNSAPPV